MKSMTIGKKLMLSFATQMVLLALLSWVLLSGFSAVKGSFDAVVGKSMRVQRLATEIYAEVWAMRAAQRGRDLYTYANNQPLVEASKQRDKLAKERIREGLVSLRPLATTTEEKALVEEVQKAMATLDSVTAEIEKFAATGNTAEIVQLAGQKMVPLYEPMIAKCARLVAIQDELVAKQKQDTNRLVSTNNWSAAGVMALTLVVGAFALFMVRQISNTLHRIAQELSQGSEHLTGAAAQVSSSSQSLAQGASEQAASLEETSASTEEINSMTLKNAENSDNSAKLMAEMAGQVAAGLKPCNRKPGKSGKTGRLKPGTKTEKPGTDGLIFACRGPEGTAEQAEQGE